jgi:uncharacterized protein (TIRG00374 family)
LSKTLANILKYLVFLAIALVLLYLAFKDNNPQKMLEDLRQANYLWVLVGSVCGYLAMVSRGIRWNILLEPMGYKPSVFNSINAVNVGYLANMAVPRLGEVTRCTAMNRAEKIPVDKLIGTVIIERIVDMIMLALMFGLTLVLKYDALSSFIGKSFEGRKASPSAGLPVWVWIVLAFVTASILVVYLFRTTLMQLKWVGRAKNLFLGIAGGFKSVLLVRRRGAFLFHTVFIWGMYFLMSYLSFYCLPATNGLTLSDGLFIMIVGGIAMIAPAPGGLGAFHAAVILGLTTLGIDADSARSYAVIAHSSQTLMMLCTGAVALFLLSLSRKKAPHAVL